MSVAYCDAFDFENILEDLSGSDTTSSEETSSTSEEVKIPPKVRRRFLRIDQTGNKRSKMFEVDGTVVAFEARFPKPRVVYTDIRRCYANMFVNAMNSHDFALLYGFLDTFCTPNTFAVQRKATPIRAAKMTVEQGLFAMGRKLYARMQIAPDSVLNIANTSIVAYSGTKETRIISQFTSECTEIFDRDSLCERLKSCDEVMNTKRKDVEHNTMKDIMRAIDNRVVTAKLSPKSQKAVGELILYVDEQKRIIKIEKNFRML